MSVLPLACVLMAAAVPNTQAVRWVKLTGELGAISAGPVGVWGFTLREIVYLTSSHGFLFHCFSSPSWQEIPRNEKYQLYGIDVGPGTVFVATNAIFYREAISDCSPSGSQWKSILDTYGQRIRGVTASPNGNLWIRKDNGRMMFREGVSSDNPYGKSWVDMGMPSVNDISAGKVGLWIINGRDLYYRTDTYGDEPGIKGTGFEMVPSVRIFKIAVGSEVFGRTYDGKLVRRLNVTSANPKGTGWEEVQQPSSDGIHSLDTFEKTVVVSDYEGNPFIGYL